jgi:transcriptional regulator with XRE-family HTH domain
MSIGERITQLRKERNLSQGDLAKAMDVSRQAVSKWENDSSSPDTIKLIRLAEVLDTQVGYLATGRMIQSEDSPIVLNMVKTEEKIVEKVVEKPVVRKITRVKYLRNPVEFAVIGSVCFILGFILGLLL